MRRGWSLWFVGRFLSHARRGFGGFHRCCHAHRFQQLRTAAAAGVAMVHRDGNKSNKSGSTSGNKRGKKGRQQERNCKQQANSAHANGTTHCAQSHSKAHQRQAHNSRRLAPYCVSACVLVVSVLSDVSGSRFALSHISLLQTCVFLLRAPYAFADRCV